MNRHLFRPLLGAAALVFAAHAFAQISFYADEGFRGRVFSTDRPIRNFERSGFNDRASSVIVDHGRWEVCEDARFKGRCVVLKPGSYDSLRRLGLQDRISSVRPADRRHRHDEATPQPVAAPPYEYRRRPHERLYEAKVIAAHAVLGQAQQRCWVEHQQAAAPEPRDLNVPGALIGGVIGGILGHQVGGGRGKTAATIGAAVGGAALGANVDRFRDGLSGQGQPATHDVRRCEPNARGTPEYWDVTYDFRGSEHHVQMSRAPGDTITVNRAGVPRQ